MSKMMSIVEAASRGNIPWLRQLVKKEKSIILLRDEDGVTPLMYAAENGSTKAVEFLIESGADPHACDFGGDPTLFYALFGEEVYLEIVDQLTQAGVDIDTPNKKKQTALHVAAITGSAAIASFLIGLGANADKRDTDGRTPLFYAASENNEEVVILLIETGVEIDQSDNWGRTALMIACQKNFPKIVSHLINAGADVCKFDRFKKTPIDYFKESEMIPNLIIGKFAEEVRNKS